MKEKLQPHEVTHLLGRRLFVFLDEWMTYGIMLYLYNNNPELFWVMLPPAILLNYEGYIGLWQLREEYGLGKNDQGSALFGVAGFVTRCTSYLMGVSN